MASILNATTTSGLVTSADNSGSLQLQTNNGTAALSISTGQQLQVHTAGTASAPVISKSDDTNTGILFPAADTIAFTEGGVESMRIDSSGNLLVGTTSTSRTANIGIKNVISTSPDVVVVGSGTTNSDVAFEAYSTGASAFRFQVGYGGTIYATSTTITGISDQRLKENIIDLDDGLDAVMALKPRKFDWKAGKGKDIKGDRGFIAQEFEQVFPDMIEESKDPVPEGEKPYKAVNANIIPTLVKAIQEQQAQIEELKADLQALKGAQ